MYLDRVLLIKLYWITWWLEEQLPTRNYPFRSRFSWHLTIVNVWLLDQLSSLRQESKVHSFRYIPQKQSIILNLFSRPIETNNNKENNSSYSTRKFFCHTLDSTNEYNHWTTSFWFITAFIPSTYNINWPSATKISGEFTIKERYISTSKNVILIILIGSSTNFD